MFKKLLLLVLAVAPLSLCAQKFAHFDYAAIIQAMPEAKAAQADLEALYKQYQAELENMQKELQEMYQRLQQAQQDNSDNFQAEQQKKMQPVTQKVMDAVNAVAQQGGYVYIVDKNAAQGAGIVINEQLSTDVTGAIMQKLGMPESAAKPAAAPAK